MICTVQRGLSDIKELKKVEAEEAVKSTQTGPSDSERQPTRLSLNIVESSDPTVGWSLPSDFALSLGLFADLGIPKSVETPLDIQLNS